MTIQKYGAEPRVEALVRIVFKLGQLSPKYQENVLHQIRAVGMLLAQFIRPMVKQWRIQIDESPPGSDLIGPAESV